MYVNMNKRDPGGGEPSDLGSHFSTLGLSERAARPRDPIPCPRAAPPRTAHTSSPSPDSSSRNTSPESVPDDSYVVILDDHDTNSIPSTPSSDLQSWVSGEPSRQMSVDSDGASLNTCLKQAEMRARAAKQKAFEQSVLLNKLPNNFDASGGFPNRGGGDENGEEVKHLMQKLVLCEKEKADGKNEATELRHQLDRLRDDNAKLHSMMQNMNSFGETDALKAKVHSLTEEAKRLSQEKSTLSQQLIDFRRDTNHEIEKLQTNIEEATRTIEQNTTDMNKMSRSITHLKEENTRLACTAEDLKSSEAAKTNHAMSEKRKISEELRKKDGQIKALEQKLSICSQERTRWENSDQDKSEELVAAQRKIEKYVDLYQKVKQDHDALKQEVEELREIKCRNGSIELELANSKKAADSATKELEMFKFNENLLRTETATLKQKHVDLETELKRLRKVEREGKNKEENWASIIQKLQQQLEESEKNGSSFQEEKSSMTSAMEGMEQENLSLKKKMQEMELELQKVAQQNPTYEEIAQYAQNCHHAYQQKEIELSQYAEAYRHLQMQMQALSHSGNEEMRKANLKLAQELNEMTERASANLAKLTDAQHRYEECQRMVDRKDGEIYEVKKKFEEAGNQVELYKIQVADYEKDFHDERNRANELKNQFENEKEQLEMKHAQLTAEIEDLKKENKDLKLANSKLGQMKMEEDERALGRTTPRYPNERVATQGARNGPTSGGATTRGVDRNNSQYSRPPNAAGGRPLSGYEDMYGSSTSVDLSASGRYNPRGSLVGDTRRGEPSEQRGGVGGGAPQRGGAAGSSFASKFNDYFNPKKPVKPKEAEPALICPFCDESNFPNADGLQVHINEDHPDV